MSPVGAMKALTPVMLDLKSKGARVPVKVAAPSMAVTDPASKVRVSGEAPTLAKLKKVVEPVRS